MTIIVSVLFVIAVHELGHALAVILTRAGKVQGMVINLRGIGLKWEPYGHEPIKRSIVSLSGPLVNLTLAVFFYGAGLEFLGTANVIFGVVNLMPLPGADGLRAFAHLREAT